MKPVLPVSNIDASRGMRFQSFSSYFWKRDERFQYLNNWIAIEGQSIWGKEIPRAADCAQNFRLIGDLFQLTAQTQNMWTNNAARLDLIQMFISEGGARDLSIAKRSIGMIDHVEQD